MSEEEEFAKKLEELERTLEKAYDILVEIQAIKCKRCGRNCDDTKREMETCSAFAGVTYTFARNMASEKLDVSSVMADSIVMGGINLRRACVLVMKVHEMAIDDESVNYIW